MRRLPLSAREMAILGVLTALVCGGFVGLVVGIAWTMTRVCP